MNDYIISVDENGTPSLQHYGVLGMRWGVRHDRQRAYRRASKKRDRLNAKAAKKQEKADAAMSKARKAPHGATTVGRTIWENKHLKAGKKQYTADKATKKADKWMKAMEQEFAGIPMSELER